MRKWIEFNIKHPKTVIVVLLLITFVSLFGMKRLVIDSSTDALMPAHEPVYKLGQRAKKIFGDSKTFIIAAVEPAKGEKLFSRRVFSHMNLVVEEIEEFKYFNYELESRRLKGILELTETKVVPVKTEKKREKPENKKSGDRIEDEFDYKIFNGDGNGSTEKKKLLSGKTSDQGNIWDLSKPFANNFYPKPIRERNIYSYDNYKTVSINQIREALDELGRRQLDTVLIRVKMNKINAHHDLSKKEFIKILETWETLYLYKSMELVKTFMNPISGEDIMGTDEELSPRDLVEKNDDGERIFPVTDKDFEEYKKMLLGNPAYDSALYSLNGDGEFNALAFNTTFKPQRSHIFMNEYFIDLYEKYSKGPVRFTVGGVPMYTTYTKKYMQTDIKRLLPIVLAVLVVIFFLNFRLGRGVVIPFFSVIIGMIWTMGLMGFCGVPVTLIVNILPTLLIAVASSDSIHIFHQYLHDQKMIHEEGKKKGLILSMGHISQTVFLTSLTTFIGFLTLSTSQVVSLKHFGIFAAIGTVLAMVVTVTLVPAALSLMKLIPNSKSEKDKQRVHKNMVIEKIVSLFSRLSTEHYRAVTLVMVILMGVFSYGLTKIKAEAAPLYNFKEKSHVYQSDVKINDLFHGTVPLNITIDSGEKNGVKNPEFLKFADDVRKWIVSDEGKNLYHHLETFAFTDIVKRMNKAMNSESPSSYSIPGKKQTVEEYLEIYSGEDRDSDGRVDTFEQFIDRDYRELNIVLRTGSYKGKLYSSTIGKAGVERIKKYMSQHPLGRKYKWHVTGESLNFAVLGDLILHDQLNSVILTFILVVFLMSYLFRNWKAGAVSVIPLGASIIIVYGTMGYVGIPLDIAKCLLAAVAVGIGIDDTIHMMRTLRHYLKEGMPMKEAVAASHKEAGSAICHTSIALIFSFSVFMLSEFNVIFYLGWLVAFTMLTTTVSALLFLPSVINLLKIDLCVKPGGGFLKIYDLKKILTRGNRKCKEGAVS